MGTVLSLRHDGLQNFPRPVKRVAKAVLTCKSANLSVETASTS